jgi:DNA-binding LacI/PurR family transcriptional regulator
MKKFANMEELAAELKLSRGTVSYILNGKWQSKHISPKTAKRVLDFAEKVNFTPSLFGRALKGKICTDAAVFIPTHMYEHHRDTFFAILDLFEQQKLSYLVLPLRNDNDKKNFTALQQLQTFKVSKVIIFAATLNIEEVKNWKKIMASLPEVSFFLYDYRMEYQLNRDFFPENVSGVGFDRIEAFKLIIKHVAQKGYRTLFYRVPFYTDENTQNVANLEGVELCGVEVESSWGEFIDKIEDQLCLSSLNAIFCPDDLQAIELIKLLKMHNLYIPTDVGVISWDGLKVSLHFSPIPETLAVPHEDMREAAKKFLTGKVVGFTLLSPVIRQGETLPLKK